MNHNIENIADRVIDTISELLNASYAIKWSGETTFALNCKLREIVTTLTYDFKIWLSSGALVLFHNGSDLFLSSGTVKGDPNVIYDTMLKWASIDISNSNVFSTTAQYCIKILLSEIINK
jgi:hypothetical protein